MRQSERRHAAWVVVAVALVLSLPSLLSPLFVDEYVQAIKWRASSAGSFLMGCFVFATENGNLPEMEHGFGAWWTAPDFKVAFWRPIPAATHALDLACSADALSMHLHSLVWFAALLVMLHALYRRFLKPRVACLALALYAWDDARGMVLSWIANRHSLIAGVAGLGAIAAHDEWRRKGWRPGAWLGPALFAMGLLSGEMGLATLCFLLAHAAFLDDGAPVRRVLRLVPYLLVALVWQSVWMALGYGAQGSDSYTHPLLEPGAFAWTLIQRAPVLWLGQLTPIPGDAWSMVPSTGRVVVFALALIVGAGVWRVMSPRVRADAQARFWLLGAGLSLALVCSTGPQDRNLVFVGFGVAPLLAMLFEDAANSRPSSRLSRMTIGGLVLFNLLLAPLQLPLKSLMMLAAEGMMEPVNDAIPRDPTVTKKTLLIPWMAFEPAVYYSWARRDVERVPRPSRTRILATSMGDVSVTRIDDTTLRVEPRDGFFGTEASRMVRGASRPFHPGDVVRLSNMTATVMDVTHDGRPQMVEFHFTAPLESPEWLWMRGAGQGLVAWTPPKVGETVVLPVP